MVSLRLNNSPRVPSFAGPIALAAGLLSVICFSEPFWQNFYVIKADSLNVTMKAGAWGVCTRLRNATNINGPTGWCTSKTSGYNLNFVTNTTAGGINDFPTFLQNGSTPTPIDDSVLFGTTRGANGIQVLTSSQTNLYWLQVVTAISANAAVASLLCPPAYLGSPQSRLFAFQKSGILPILLALLTVTLSFVTFFITLTVSMSGRNRLNKIDGISAGLGNTIWYTLASSIVMLPAIASVLMRSSPNEYQDL